MTFQRHSRSPLPGTRRLRAAFTLAEALVAISIIALAGSALLLSSQTSLDSSQEALDQTIAQGVANQLLDEILGLPYMEAGESAEESTLGFEPDEFTTPQRRIVFDDTDDFEGYVAAPLEDAWAIELGLGDGNGNLRHPNFRLRDDFFDDWVVAIRVRYADETDLAQNLPAPSTSGFRSVEVTVGRQQQDGSTHNLAIVRRVYAYVPPVD